MALAHEIPELDNAGLRKFGITTGCIVAILFGFVLPWLFDFSRPLWPFIVAAVLILWGLIAPATLNTVYRVWMRFGLLLGSITSPIVLSVVFFAMFVPIALFFRVTGRDALNRQIDEKSTSYRIKVEKPKLENLEKPF